MTANRDSIDDELEILKQTWSNHWRNLPMEEPIIQLESEISRLSGKKYCLAHSSGTMALLAAYFGVGVAPGTEVIVPSLACSSVASPLLMLGAKPVFCDIDPQTLCMDPESVKDCLSQRTRAICAVHLWGNVCDMQSLTELAREANIELIEDCAQAPGARYKGRSTGSFGTVSVFSMQGSKALRGGEGGAIATNSPDVYNRILFLGHHGRIQQCLVNPSKMLVEMGETTLGLKLRPHVLAMALSLNRLRQLERENMRRREIVDCYDRIFLDTAGVLVVRQYPGVVRGGFFVDYPLIYTGDLKGKKSISEVAYQCYLQGLPVKVQRYPPLHLEKTFRVSDSLLGRSPEVSVQMQSIPNVERIAPRILSLPLLERANKDLVSRIAEILAGAMG